MRRTCFCWVGLATLAITLLLPAVLHAQADGEYWGLAQFNFQNPGARARALGGAFVALADDATAAYSNPAGLAFLTRWEVGLEYSSVAVEGQAAQLAGDYQSNYRPNVQSFDADGLTFGSIVIPLKKGRATASVFYSSLSPLSNAKGSFGAGGGVVLLPSFEASDGFEFFPALAFLQAKNEVAGASLGVRLSDRFSIGGTVGVTELQLDGYAERYSYEYQTLYNYQYSIVDKEQDTFATVGFVWAPSEKWTIGGSWQKESSFDVSSKAYIAGTGKEYRDISSTFRIPTKWALGLAFRISDAWVLSLEADRIEYSDTYRGMNEESFFKEFDAPTDSEYGFSAANVTELHLGSEYSWFSRGGTGFSVRLGVWQDTEHLPHFTGATPHYRERTPKWDDKIVHYAGGFGLSFKHLMLDLAYDYTSDNGTASIGSLVFRF